MKFWYSAKAKILRFVFPNTPEELRDSAAVVVKLGIISAVVTVLLATIQRSVADDNQAGTEKTSAAGFSGYA